LARKGANLKLSFAFMTPTAAAVFYRADTLWIVFDSKADIDLSALAGESSRTIRSADLTHAPDADIVRIKLDRPHLASVAVDGPVWTVEVGDSILESTKALDLTRNLIGPNRSSVTIPFEEAHQLHRISDPEVGDQLVVVTAFAPVRGFIHTQDFVEFRALASTQGVVVEPLADDVNVELAPAKVVVSRPNGLTLSSSLQALLRGSGLRPVTFDSQLWGFDRQASYVERQSHLIDAAAAAPENKRLGPRLDLARFYLARDMYPEAKGVLDVVLADERPAVEDVSATVLRAAAEIMMNRPEDALKDLADPAVGDQHDAALWRALAYARQGKWAQAREGLKTVEAAVATLPIELQRVALKDEMRASIEVGDFAGAENALNDFETIGVPHDMQPAMSVLIGRLDEGMGRTEDALAAYRTAADSWDRPAAAQGRLRETVLRHSLGDLKREDVVSELESLTTVWRGDETEIEALQVLARLYTEEGRYRDSFYVMRSAMTAHPDWDMTRRIQEEAAKTFDSLFLAGKGDSMPAIDALALFYDFRELTPIGSRGDEMIRRLADRLVSVDLLDQAADLLQYQVDNRLQGAARAQVATQLAVIYLMNRKPDRALATLRATRTADLSTELRNQRLLLEGRALSDLGRHDFALEVIANIDGREAIRLRSDILWAARRWRESAEQVELMYGDRWKEWQPLSDVERADILRAEIGYALGEDTLGLERFREKYAAKMAGTPDARAFEIVSAPLGTSGAGFADIAHAAASVDTLEGFLRDMKARYPEASAISATAAPPAAQPSGEKTAPSTSSRAPQARPPAPPAPPSHAAGRTALK
ncbi:MAG: tetratricopeptide repeat protein, partial [Xanthobacteraceae bacterium]